MAPAIFAMFKQLLEGQRRKQALLAPSNFRLTVSVDDPATLQSFVLIANVAADSCPPRISLELI